MFKLVIVFILFSGLNLWAKASKNPVDKVEFVLGKTNSKVVTQVKKDFHGKVKKETVEKIINEKVNQKELDKFLGNLHAFLNENLKGKNLTQGSKGRVKVQLQDDGRFDILFIEVNKPALYEKVEKYFANEIDFPAIPEQTGQSEMQILIYLN